MLFPALVLSLALSVPAAAPPPPTTVVILRHAEKSSSRANSSLSAAGRRRAQALAAELAPLGPAALYASDRWRTRQTLEPLSRRLGLPLLQRPLGSEEELGPEILRLHAGRTVVVCGHSDTLGTIAASLGWEGPFPVVDGFERLFVVRVPAGGEGVTLEERTQRTPP